MSSRKLNLVKEYGFIILGTTLLAMSINIFFNPNQIVIGGFTGLGIIIENFSSQFFGYSIPLPVTNIVFNVPLFLIGYKALGRGFLGRTAFATFYLSFALIYTKVFPVFNGDMTLIAVFGGMLTGVGIGFVFRGFGSTGGVDLAATILHRYFNHFSVSKMMFVMDASIILLGLFVFGLHKAMYAMIAIYISTKCIGTILEGMSFSKAAFIISDRAEEISKRLMTEVNRGVTALHGKGMYSGLEKDILLCVFSQKEITKVKKEVREIDSKAFIMVTDFKEVLGEGFQSMI